jgi:hypothetical protein
VYVGYDSRAAALPAWLADGTWALTSEWLATGPAAGAWWIYMKTVPAGDLVLGGNRAAGGTGAPSHYIVIVQSLSDAGGLPPSFVEGPVPADCWEHGGDDSVDSDGDGLWDEFEASNPLPSYALDPSDADTAGNGTADEDVRVADGRTLWEVQSGLPAGDGAAGGGPGGGSHCGSIGLDLMAPLVLMGFLRRMRSRRNGRG